MNALQNLMASQLNAGQALLERSFSLNYHNCPRALPLFYFLPPFPLSTYKPLRGAGLIKMSRSVIVDDNDSGIKYVGGWTSTSGSNWDKQGNFGATYLNTLHSTTTGGSFSYMYEGMQMHFYFIFPS